MIHRNGTRNGSSVAGPAPVDNSALPAEGGVVTSWTAPLWAARTEMIPKESIVIYSTERVTVRVSDLGEFHLTLEQDDSIEQVDGRFAVVRSQPTVRVEWTSSEEFSWHVADALGRMSLDEAAEYADTVRKLVGIARDFGGDR
jgi:hypothetical protein